MTRRRRTPDLRTTAECRDYGHAWDPYDGGRNRRGPFRVLICRRCLTERHQQLDRKGHVIGGSYKYEKDYLITGGKLTTDERGQLRLFDMDMFEKGD